LKKEPEMKGRIVRLGKIITGGALIVVGIAGLFLPFLQGILFLLLGLSLLSSESEHARRWLEWLKQWARRTRPGKGADQDG
jgi:uncharacterized membrane protein YbaN (DUF454 family)